MCGIFCVVCEDCSRLLAEKFLNKVQNQLDRRGHDAIQSHTISLPNGKTLISYGCVLGMRGPITGQPLVDPSNGNWLLWNGEIYDGLPIDPSANDADLLMKYLSDCNGDSNAILQSIERLNGPWSMIYWESSSYSLWMGRDAIGRRSLVWHLPQSHDDIFIISSVGSIDSSPDYWNEVPAIGVYQYTMTHDTLLCHPWIETDTNQLYIPNGLDDLSSLKSSLNIGMSSHQLSIPFSSFNMSLPSPTDPEVNWNQLAIEFASILEDAVKKRLICSTARPSGANVAVLFSGGLDSAVLAALVDRCIEDSNEEIDLVNVAFDQSKENDISNFDVPDRLSAIQTLQELNPARKWNLILVNVLEKEVTEMRKEYIAKCVHPLTTVLDDSLGCVLWFAGRGLGELYPSKKQYQSTARIVLVGGGADEQLAGYARHRTHYKVDGIRGLLQEVHKDVKRLSWRNLGRDDRCIADHHKESRLPYLDEKVVDYLNKLPVWAKADLELPRGVGEKRLLREVAILLGCPTAAGLPKRAMQFGSRVASLQSTKCKGSDQSQLLL